MQRAAGSTLQEKKEKITQIQNIQNKQVLLRKYNCSNLFSATRLSPDTAASELCFKTLVNLTYQRSHLRQPCIVMCKWRSLRSGGLQRRVRGTYGILDMQLRTSSSKGSKQNEERKAEERNGRPALVLIIMQ